MHILWPSLALLYSAAFWGLVWYPLRLLEQAGVSGPWQTLVSYGAVALVFLPVLVWRRRELALHPIGLALLGLASGWTNVAFVLAMLDGTVVRVLLLFYLSPLWATLLAHWWLAEPVSRATWMTLPVGLAGAALMLWDPQLGSPWPTGAADWLALSAGLAFATTNVITRRLQAVGIRLKTWFAWLGVVVVALLVIVWRGEPLPAVSVGAWTGVVTLGLAGFLFSTLLVVYGVTHLPAQHSAVILLFEIVVGALSAWWLAGEGLEGLEWLGGCLILAAGLVAIVSSAAAHKA
jgi:drug/metabolite transporter (DMT)-like permease